MLKACQYSLQTVYSVIRLKWIDNRWEFARDYEVRLHGAHKRGEIRRGRDEHLYPPSVDDQDGASQIEVCGKSFALRDSRRPEEGPRWILREVIYAGSAQPHILRRANRARILV